MKITLGQKRRQDGNILMVILVSTFLVGFLMVSYLAVVSQQNQSIARSQTWNSAIPVAEAGIEEALAHLNYNCLLNPTDLTKTVKWTADDWVKEGNTYTVTRFFGTNWDSPYYKVTIDTGAPASTNNPIITAEGYVPTLLSAVDLPSIFAYANDGSSTSTRQVGVVSRKVQVMAKVQPLFAHAIAADGKIDLGGNDMFVDSYDSVDGTNRVQYSMSRRRDKGSVATNSGLTNSLLVGNANVFGPVSTGPGGSISVGPNGGVGDLSWNADNANNGKIQPGWSTDDMNVEFPEVKAPFAGGYLAPRENVRFTNAYTGWLTNRTVTKHTSGTGKNRITWHTTNTTVTLVTNQTVTVYRYVFDSGNYKISGLNNESVLVVGNATVWVDGDISLKGNDVVDITSSGSLKLYAGGNVAFAGNATINNMSYKAEACSIFGLPTCTSVTLGGNGNMVGTVYAPNANITMNGGGASVIMDFSGAVVGKTVTLNGHYDFHYDENLANSLMPRAFVVTEWKEL
jgi:hypothetical protein